MRLGVRQLAIGGIAAAGLLGVAIPIGRRVVRERGRSDYHREIAPIIAQHCLECHRSSGIGAAVELDTERAARLQAPAIRRSVAGRTMPPFVADNTGDCGSWRDPRWLRSDEIAAIVRWTDAEAPPKSDSPLVFTPPSAPAFRVDRTVDLGGPYAPEVHGAYRCFVADPRLDADRFLRGARVVSTDPRGVAQVNLFALEGAGEAEVTALDQADASPGYPCYGSARTDGARLVASWTAGDPSVRLPEGTGIHLGAGRKVVIQMRYDLASAGADFRADTRVDLELVETAHAVEVVPLRVTGKLPPRQSDVRVRTTLALGPGGHRILGATPWMHERGRFMQLRIERDGGPRTCLATFDHWRPRYQRSVFALAPASVAPNERITLECGFQTQGVDHPLPLDDRMEAEECVAHLFVVDD